MDSEGERPVLELSLDRVSEYGLYPHAEILGRICSILPISNVEVLSISASETIQSANWHQFFQRCKKITEIQAQGRGTSDLLQSLAPQELVDIPSDPGPWKGKGKNDNSATHVLAQVANDTAGGSRTTTTVISFPKPTSLSLENLNFNDTVPSSGVLFDVFVNALQWRKTNALPSSNLTIYTCKITAEWADCLKKHVQDPDWDGYENPYYLEDDDPIYRWETILGLEWELSNSLVTKYA
jgi:hypothetical protein